MKAQSEVSRLVEMFGKIPGVTVVQNPHCSQLFYADCPNGQRFRIYMGRMATVVRKTGDSGNIWESRGPLINKSLHTPEEINRLANQEVPDHWKY